MSKLVMIRGNSGSGKTTVAKKLQHQLGPNTMVISQDVIRREILWVKDGANTKALSLLAEMLIYGQKHCEIVILEGILYSKWYMPVFELGKNIFGNQILAYYYNIPFEETLFRHGFKRNHQEFGENEMKKWWHEKDYLKIIPEKTISKDKSIEEVVEIILTDISAHELLPDKL